MTHTDAYIPPQIYTVRVMSTKLRTTIYTFKIAQTSPEKAKAFVTDQLGLGGGPNYYVFVATKPVVVSMRKG